MQLLADKTTEAARVVVETLEVAVDDYLGMWPCLAHPPVSVEDDALGAKATREASAELGTLLAYANRLVADGNLEVSGKLTAPPAAIIRVLRDLADSYALLAHVTSYDEILQQPLVDPADIRTGLDEPAARQWLAAVASSS